jgi:hypothetical protein
VGHSTDDCVIASGATDDDVFMWSRVDPRFATRLPREMWMTSISYLPAADIVPTLPRACKLLDAMVYTHPAGPLMWREVVDVERVLVRACGRSGAPLEQIDAILHARISLAGLAKAMFASVHSRMRNDVLSSLIEAKADVNAFDHETGRTLLSSVCMKRRPSSAHILIAAGADVNHVCMYGHTALGYAVRGRHVSMVRVLIAARANVHAGRDDVLSMSRYQYQISRILRDPNPIIAAEAERARRVARKREIAVAKAAAAASSSAQR